MGDFMMFNLAHNNKEIMINLAAIAYIVAFDDNNVKIVFNHFEEDFENNVIVKGKLKDITDRIFGRYGYDA